MRRALHGGTRRVTREDENGPAGEQSGVLRLKAEEAQVMADNLRDPQARQHMLSAARCYQRLAIMAARGPLLVEHPKAANAS